MDTLALSTSVRLPLRVCSKFHYDVSKWQVVPQLTVFPMTCTGHCRITQEKKKKTALFDIWSMLSQPCAVCACTRVPAFLNSARMQALNINISLNDR